MTLEAYLVVASLCGAYFGFQDLEYGDYPRVTSAVIVAALWPVAAAFGLGLMLHAAWRFLQRAYRRIAA